MDWAWSDSTTLLEVSSMTVLTSSLLGAGLEMTLMSRERRSVPVRVLGVAMRWGGGGSPSGRRREKATTVV